MAVYIDLYDLNTGHVILQKKVLLLFHCSGLSQNKFCKRLDIGVSYIVELKKIGRVYDPKYSLLHKFINEFNLDYKWFLSPEELPMEYFFIENGERLPDLFRGSETYKRIKKKRENYLNNEIQELKNIESILKSLKRTRDETMEGILEEYLTRFFQPLDVHSVNRKET